MNLLFITPSDKIGGGNRVMFELARCLQPRHRVTCVFPRSPARPQYPIAPGIRSFPVGIVSRQRLSVLANLVFLYVWLRRNIGDFDAVLSTGQITGILLPWLRHRRLINFIQTDEFEIFRQGHLARHPLLYRIYAHLMEHSLRHPRIEFIFNSSYTHRLFTSIRPGRPVPKRIVTPGIDTDVFHPWGRSRPGPRLAVCSLGRSSALKGLDVLLESFHLLPQDIRRRTAWHLIAYDRDLGRRLPPEFSLSRPCGDRPLADILRRSDIFLSTSLWEGFGLPALEAMACGCAVITSRNGGCQEYAQDGVNCLTYPPHHPQALAQCLQRLVVEPQLRRRLAHRGTATALNFTWQKAAAALEKILEAKP